MIYVSTECVIGHGYDAINDHNLYRVTRDSYFEYLDVTEPESVQALHQAVRHLLSQINEKLTIAFRLSRSGSSKLGNGTRLWQPRETASGDTR